MMKRMIAMVVAMAMMISLLPATAFNVFASEADPQRNLVAGELVADAGTAHTWETMMGTAYDGNRYAGRVWADKSVFTDGQTALLDSQGGTYQVELNQDEAFQTIFSVLGSSMTTTTTTSYVGPMDVVLVLDTSTSMAEQTGGKSRMERMLTAANGLLEDLLTIPNLRLSVVTYNADSETVLELAHYTNGVTLSTNHYTNTNGGGIISAHDKDGKLLGNDSGYTRGTNLQAGIDRGFQILANATGVSGRVPVAIVLTDGEANRAVRNHWYNASAGTVGTSGTTGIALSTLLNAAYNKVCIEKNYGKAPMVYGVGVDLSSGGLARALMDPGDANNGFNSNNSSGSVRSAYSLFQDWARGQTVTSGSGNSRWTFDHNLPASPAVTSAEVAANINYVDTYYNVASADLEVTFTEIYEELSSGAFNPISSTQTVVGGTGVENTPLIFVDTLGQYMQIKRIQQVTLFDATYAVIQNADGTYTVATGTGTNPTTSEVYNTTEDIRISVTDNTDGSQTLRIEIDQQILPILLEKVLSKTEDGVTSVTIEEVIQQPLRVYYTVGLSESILTDGKVDPSKIAEGYPYMDAENRKIHFYSNAFGKTNTSDADGDGFVDMGDAHVGFKPSAANRFYYHQTNLGIFSSVEAKDGSAIYWDASEYGVLYEEGQYDLTYLSYEDYRTLQNSDLVYTYVNYYRPTADTSDAANAAEKVTYLVYTKWGYLKESVSFYDRTANVYVNYAADGGYTTGDKGYAIPMDQVAATIEAYIQANPDAEMQAVLGIGSLRTSRLHNMMVEKEANATGTAELRYDPEYTYDTAEAHSGNDVVIWLGNNGRLSVEWDPDQEITIEKIWDDAENQDGIRPETITVHLTAINSQGKVTKQTLVLSASEGWTKTITAPIRDADGYTLTYSLTEDAVEGYTGSISTFKDQGTISFAITNAHTPLETSVTVLKRWDDADNQDGIRPGSITVELYADGMATGKIVTLSADNHWTYSWENLPLNANGKEIAYTVVESDVPEGYVSDVLSDEYVGLLEIVNTHEPEKTQVSVEKVWNDAGDQDGIRPESITVELYADGLATGKLLILNADNGWKGSFTDIDKFSNGTAVVYTVKEVSVPAGYTVAITGDAATGFTITNTHEVEKTEITVRKVWNDAGNQDGKRPVSITVNLYANGEKIATQVLDASMNWTYTWTDLDLNENGTPIVYTVDEIAVDGYTTSIDGLVITNTHEVEKTEISVSKVWNDENNQDGKRPTGVTVHLLANGTHTGQTVVLSEENGWTYTWTDLDKYADGEEINYTVYEEAVEGYTATYTRDSADDQHVIITNSYTPEKTALTVQKVWEDAHNQDGIRPESITVELYANGEPTGLVLTITAADHWKGSFTDLDKYAEGVEITYTVKETPIEGYTTNVSVDERTGIVTVTNTHIPETVDVTVNKVWVDNNDQDGIRPDSVVLELYANGEPTGKTVTVSADGNWQATFRDLPKYENSVEVIYTVQEVNVPAGYTASASGTTVTNTHIPETTQVTVNKVWVDNGNQDGIRPATVTVELFANGTKIDTQVLDASMNWTYTWTGLDKNANGEEITYTVQESIVPTGYTAAITGNMEAGFTITNTHEVEKTEISVSKVWNDENNQDGKRPASVTVHLLANGAHTGQTVVLSEENGWSYTWTDLDENHNGTKINYTVYEEAVEGYTATYTLDGENRVIITNSYAPEKTGLTVQKVWVDNDNQDGIRPATITVELYANGEPTGIRVELNEGNSWRYSFTDLDKFVDGKEITYTVVELTEVDGYQVSYAVDTETGLYEIINTHEPEKTQVSVEKVWNDAGDQDGIRPESITVELYADGLATGKLLILNADNGWKGSFTDIDKFSNGTAVVYTVKEVSVPAGYTVAITGDAATGFTITNTHAPEVTDIPVEKLWEDHSNQDGIRPGSVTIALLANGEDTGLRVELNAQNGWKGVFEKVPVNSNGQPIEYSFQEVNVPEGYTVRYEGNTVINTHIPALTGIQVSKVWDDNDNQDGIRPDTITVELYANGLATGNRMILSAENGWTYVWTDLQKFENGVEILYTVVEIDVAQGYTAEYTQEGSVITITNTHVPETVTVSVSKLWDDENDRDGVRPDQVVFVLVIDGVVTEQAIALNDQNNWYGQWTDLPKYENGTEILYTVVEINVTDGYVSIVDPDADNHYQFIVTNRYAPKKTGLTVTKVWVDEDNALGARPESIVVALLANGVVVDEVVLDESNGWTYTWNDLYMYENGEMITYTLQEINIDEDYIVSYDSVVGADGVVYWQITNTLVEPPPDTGDNIQHMFLLMITSMAGILILLPVAKKKGQEAEN